MQNNPYLLFNTNSEENLLFISLITTLLIVFYVEILKNFSCSLKNSPQKLSIKLTLKTRKIKILLKKDFFIINVILISKIIDNLLTISLLNKIENNFYLSETTTTFYIIHEIFEFFRKNKFIPIPSYLKKILIKINKHIKK